MRFLVNNPLQKLWWRMRWVKAENYVLLNDLEDAVSLLMIIRDFGSWMSIRFAQHERGRLVWTPAGSVRGREPLFLHKKNVAEVRKLLIRLNQLGQMAV